MASGHRLAALGRDGELWLWRTTFSLLPPAFLATGRPSRFVASRARAARSGLFPRSLPRRKRHVFAIATLSLRNSLAHRRRALCTESLSLDHGLLGLSHRRDA